MYCSSGLFSLFCIAVLYEYKEGGYMRIKRKVSISCLGGRLGICLLLALCRNCFCAGRQCTFHS